MNEDVPSLPRPDTGDPDTAPFWEACTRHEYVMQRCGHCGHFRYPPRPVCHHCQSSEHEWVRLPETGRIYSYTVAVHPVHPAVVDHVPYSIILVEVDEAHGERVIGTLLGSPPDAIRIGARVTLEWQDLADGVTLPQWRLTP
jgi:uncharacterized OB-fold protein